MERVPMRVSKCELHVRADATVRILAVEGSRRAPVVTIQVNDDSPMNLAVGDTLNISTRVDRDLYGDNVGLPCT